MWSDTLAGVDKRWVGTHVFPSSLAMVCVCVCVRARWAVTFAVMTLRANERLCDCGCCEGGPACVMRGDAHVVCVCVRVCSVWGEGVCVVLVSVCVWDRHVSSEEWPSSDCVCVCVRDRHVCSQE